MISILFSVLPFVLIVFYYIMLSAKGGLSDFATNLRYKKSGLNCYECSQHIHDLCPDHALLCKSCERDRSVKSILNPIKAFKYKFDKFFFSKNFEKHLSKILIFAISLIVVQVILLFFDIKISSIFVNAILTIYWLLMIYRIRLVFGQ
jgi:hypothetical protein